MNLNRRSFLKAGAASLGSLALPPLMQGAGKHPHFMPKAKNVIFLHMVGAPSHLDLFDYKPGLNKWHGKDAPEELYKGKTLAFITGVPKMMASPYKFKRHGQSGQFGPRPQTGIGQQGVHPVPHRRDRNSEPVRNCLVLQSQTYQLDQFQLFGGDMVAFRELGGKKLGVALVCH